MKISIVNCFCTNETDSGNPAGVVFDYTDNDEAKQELAKKLALPVTVFVSNEHATPLLRFFYPEREMDLCLHGSLGAAFLLMQKRNGNELLCLTRTGKPLQFTQSNDLTQVKIAAEPVEVTKIDEALVFKMLNLASTEMIDRNLPFHVASVGSPKLLVPLKSLTILTQLQPNLALIKDWSLQNKVAGIYCYTTDTYHSSADFHARAFNPQTGHKEDAATGVAAAALSSVLQKSIVIEQGYFVNKPSQISVNYIDDKNIYVGGKMVESKSL